MPFLLRSLVTGTLAALLLSSAIAGERELLRDRGFDRGFRLLKPESGKRLPAKDLGVPGSDREPAWEVAQWFSRWPELSAQGQENAEGERRWENAGKTITVRQRPDAEAALSLALRGSAEFGEDVRQGNEPWPHLLVEQHIAQPPALSELQALHLKLGFRLEGSHLNVPDRYDSTRHAAQYLLYFHISNMDRASKEFGHYLHFGVPLYDNRFPSPNPYFARDTGGTGMVINVPAYAEFASASSHQGEWIEIDRDILPLIHKGLERAWASGNLTDRRDLSAYRVTFITLGWELPGNLDVSAQVRGLSVRAVPATTVQP